MITTDTSIKGNTMNTVQTDSDISDSDVVALKFWQASWRIDQTQHLDDAKELQYRLFSLAADISDPRDYNHVIECLRRAAKRVEEFEWFEKERQDDNAWQNEL